MNDTMMPAGTWNHRGTSSPRFNSRPSLLIFVVVAFLISPKIDVVGVLRVEDFVFLLALPILIWSYHPTESRVPVFFYWYLAYLGIAFISTLVNYHAVGFSGVVHVLRQAQYLIWLVVGAQMAKGVSEAVFRRGMTIVAVVLIFWWGIEAVGLVPKLGKFTGATDRLTLNTSGPYETAVLVTLLLIFVRNRLVQFGLIGIMLSTQSRITLLAAVAVYLAFHLRKSILIAIPIAFVVATLLIFLPELILPDRFVATASPTQMLDTLLSQLEASPTIRNLDEYRSLGYASGLWSQVNQSAIADVSFEIRAIRWGMIIKALQSDFIRLLLGWGPGAWGVAVDGHYVRFAGETGLIGLVVFLVFLKNSVNKSKSPAPYRMAMWVMIITALFIDVFTSSKAMSFLWVIFGYSYNRLRLAGQPVVAAKFKSHTSRNIRNALTLN